MVYECAKANPSPTSFAKISRDFSNLAYNSACTVNVNLKSADELLSAKKVYRLKFAQQSRLFHRYFNTERAGKKIITLLEHESAANFIA